MLERLTAEHGFGRFGGSYVAPPLVPVLRQLAELFNRLVDDGDFEDELQEFLQSFGGRPTAIRRLIRPADQGARIYAKREDLAGSGGSYINAAAGQCLLARRAGAARVVCDTGSGHNGVATAAAAAALGLGCTVFMGSADHDRRRVMVARMIKLGATVERIDRGSAILSEAVSAAYQAWMADPATFYVSGAPVGPAPYPAMIHQFQRCVGEEVGRQIQAREARQPDLLIAALGGGSTAIGLFSPFLARAARLIVVQSNTGEPGRLQLRLGQGSMGVLHGARTLVLQDAAANIVAPPSAVAGLRYPAAPPEIAALWESGRVEAMAIDEHRALECQDELARTNGLLVSVESCHAVAAAFALADTLDRESVIVTTISAADDSAVPELRHAAH